MLLFIDNFDSFTYNLAQAFQMLGVEVVVVRGHLANFDNCVALNPRYIVIGPGPGHPSEAHLSKKILQAFAGLTPILGICLGHQALGEFYGAKVEKALQPKHGKVSPILHANRGIFHQLPQNFAATRYHSLIVNSQTICPPLEITAWTEEGEIMGLKHSTFPLESVQFHPESILTDQGPLLLRNFLDISSTAN